MPEKNFADMYRPEIFSEVFGQESAVACLAGLIRFGQRGRSILLHGPVGTGKTTLSQIYARALNCEAPAADGSPCCTDCEPCRKFAEEGITYFHVYNVGQRGGEVAQVRQWVAERNRDERVHRYRILFFDEAHVLTAKACDALLEGVEQPAEGVLFFFATTEVECLRPALRSRLFDLLVRPLSIPMAVEFLRRIAGKAEIDCEPGALELLAGLRHGYPRDLLFGLERVYDRERPFLTVAQVREAFDADQTDALVTYFEALGEGRLDRQTAVLGDWREAGSDKVRWIQGFLVSLYHNDILHRRLLLDGLIDAIPESTRRRILARFLRRLGLARPAELEPFWSSMLDFWVRGEPAGDDTALALRGALFHRLVNAAAADAGGAQREPAAPASASDPAMAAPQGIAPLARSPASLRGERDEPGFLTAQEVRRIVNCASFLIQEHGVFFNAAFEIQTERAGARTQTEAIRLIAAFRDELAAAAEVRGGAVFASITLVERDIALGVVGYLVAHLSVPDADTSGGPEEPNEFGAGLAGIEIWARAWRGSHPGASGGVLPRMAPSGETNALAFHWDVALALCGGVSDRLKVWDRTCGRYRPLCALLGIRARSTAPIRAGRVSVSERLSDAAIEQTCDHRLAPLSAFDDGAFTELRTGWERGEHADRTALRSRRAAEIERLRVRYRDDPDAARAAIEAVAESWSSDPYERARRWKGWW